MTQPRLSRWRRRDAIILRHLALALAPQDALSYSIVEPLARVSRLLNLREASVQAFEIMLRFKQEVTMYVAIRSYDGVKFPEEAAAKVRNEFLPIVSRIPGFHEYYAIKAGESSVASISIFKDKPGADESVRTAQTWVQKNMARYLPNPPKVISGDSIAHMAAKSRKSAA